MPLYPTVCASCATRFDAASPAARFCSPRCRQRAHIARRARDVELARLQTRALLRGDTHAALQLARRAISGE